MQLRHLVLVRSRHELRRVCVQVRVRNRPRVHEDEEGAKDLVAMGIMIQEATQNRTHSP